MTRLRTFNLTIDIGNETKHNVLCQEASNFTLFAVYVLTCTSVDFCVDMAKNVKEYVPNGRKFKFYKKYTCTRQSILVVSQRQRPITSTYMERHEKYEHNSFNY
jgi:hypothetical protein